MRSVSRTGVFPKQFFLVLASWGMRICFCSAQLWMLCAFFPPKLTQLNSSPFQVFTVTQNLWGKFSKVKGQAGAWFPLTTSSLLLHVLLNISPNSLCKCLWRGGWRTGNPAGIHCSQHAHGEVRTFHSELTNILWISASLQIWISRQVCQKVHKDLCTFLHA